LSTPTKDRLGQQQDLGRRHRGQRPGRLLCDRDEHVHGRRHLSDHGDDPASSTTYVGGLATHFSVTAATTATAGALTVKSLDAKGNPTFNYTSTVHFTSSDAKAVLPADYTFSASR
jgi:hypothetical protein